MELNPDAPLFVPSPGPSPIRTSTSSPSHSSMSSSNSYKQSFSSDSDEDDYILLPAEKTPANWNVLHRERFSRNNLRIKNNFLSKSEGSLTSSNNLNLNLNAANVVNVVNVANIGSGPSSPLIDQLIIPPGFSKKIISPTERIKSICHNLSKSPLLQLLKGSNPFFHKETLFFISRSVETIVTLPVINILFPTGNKQIVIRLLRNYLQSGCTLNFHGEYIKFSTIERLYIIEFQDHNRWNHFYLNYDAVGLTLAGDFVSLIPGVELAAPVPVYLFNNIFEIILINSNYGRKNADFLYKKLFPRIIYAYEIGLKLNMEQHVLVTDLINKSVDNIRLTKTNVYSNVNLAIKQLFSKSMTIIFENIVKYLAEPYSLAHKNYILNSIINGGDLQIDYSQLSYINSVELMIWAVNINKLDLIRNVYPDNGLLNIDSNKLVVARHEYIYLILIALYHGHSEIIYNLLSKWPNDTLYQEIYQGLQGQVYPKSILDIKNCLSLNSIYSNIKLKDNSTFIIGAESVICIHQDKNCHQVDIADMIMILNNYKTRN